MRFLPAIAAAGITLLLAMPPPAKALSPLWVGPAFSGSWYTASRSGEGFTLQILDNGAALAIWFTYPPAGGAAQQAWILAQDGRIEADRILFDNAFTTRGPHFGASFDPAQVQVLPWGTLEFRFTGCNQGEFSYSGPALWGSGTRELIRLTSLSELECAGKRQLLGTGARSLSGLRSRSGSWFDPAHNGEGWQLEELPDGRAQVYWFTYDERGEQAWTIGTASASGDRIEVAQNLRPMGTNFGAGFDPARVEVVPWGRLTLDFSGCDQGVASYVSGLTAFGSGTLRPVRLTRVAGTNCIASPPSVPTGGTWSAGATMPGPQSEHAVAIVGGLACVIGGFGEPRAFKCYDASANAWSNFPDAPAGRDHAEAVVINGEVLYAGGMRTDTGSLQDITGWRYRIAQARWEPAPELPDVSAGGAAVLGGFAYFADTGGSLHQVNPRTLAKRTIARDNRAPRDHSQLVAFQGELWLMGGRDGSGAENGRVSIFDPAGETWRPGPAMGTPRSGFAAAASETMIVVAGGERIASPQRVKKEVEAIAAGEDRWTALPELPFAMHGFGAVLQGNAFITLGGSRVPATASNEGQVQIYRW